MSAPLTAAAPVVTVSPHVHPQAVRVPLYTAPSVAPPQLAPIAPAGHFEPHEAVRGLGIAVDASS